LSAYEDNDLSYVENEIAVILYFIVGVVVFDICIGLVLKIMAFKVEQLSRDVF